MSYMQNRQFEILGCRPITMGVVAIGLLMAIPAQAQLDLVVTNGSFAQASTRACC